MKINKANKEDDTLRNNILIIGNGFDIANGYKTSYTDFVSFIKNKEYINYNSISKYDKFIEIVQSNIFIKHFLTIEFDFWSNVEEEIKRIISATAYVYSDGSKNRESKSLPDSYRATVAVRLDEYTKKVLYEFGLVNNCYGNHVLSSEYYDSMSGIKWNKLNKLLIDQLIDFKKLLTIYLKEIVPLLRFNHNSEPSAKVKEQIKKIEPSYIITFNYTDYYKEYFPNTEANHVHGDLKNENIVLGFDDNELTGTEYVRFKKYFQRIQNKLKPINKNDECFNVEELVLSNACDEKVFLENIISIYGLSFDITDEDYIKELFNVPNTKKVVVYYYSDEDYDNKIINLIKIFDKQYIQESLYNGHLVFVETPFLA